MTIEEAWRACRLFHNLPDTPELRLTFCFGALHGVGVTVETIDDDAALNSTIDEIQAFGQRQIAA